MMTIERTFRCGHPSVRCQRTKDGGRSLMTEVEMIRCDTHGVDIPKVSQAVAKERGLQYGCPACRDELAARPGADAMTREERAKEMRDILAPANDGPAIELPAAARGHFVHGDGVVRQRRPAV